MIAPDVDPAVATWVCIEDRAVNPIGSPCSQCRAVRLDLPMGVVDPAVAAQALADPADRNEDE